MYLFEMKNGKKKLGYGGSPEEAYENLKLRLTPEEMAVIQADRYVRISQRHLHDHIDELG